LMSVLLQRVIRYPKTRH